VFENHYMMTMQGVTIDWLIMIVCWDVACLTVNFMKLCVHHHL